MIKLLIGGSPCTYWSIAQKNGREVEAEGIGWELFKNYLIAKEKFNPDFFLYENNKSAAQPIKDQISTALGVDLMYINSALVSAQSRQRFYAFNWSVEQPQDREIYLCDVLESGLPFGADPRGKSYCVTANIAKGSAAFQTLEHHKRTMVAEPLRVGTLPNRDGNITNGQAHRIYSVDAKSVTLMARTKGGGPSTGLYAIPAVQGCAWRGRGSGSAYEVRTDGKSNAITAEGHQSRKVAISSEDGSPVYTVHDGSVEIRGKNYPIKLPDGHYIIRNLTPVECERLQTLPDGYTRVAKKTQRCRAIGNGWTAEVITHILQGALKDVPKNEEIVVLSMYDGIGTSRYCLDQMGFANVTYHAYEIDEPAKQIALSNYPDIIQRGDAFDLRREDWRL